MRTLGPQAKLIRTSGVRDFVQFNSSGYNQPRKPGSALMAKEKANNLR